MRTLLLVAGVAVLGTVWLGPLPAMAAERFAAHMSIHIAVVAAASPLIALGLAGTSSDPVRAFPRLFAPVAASIADLLVVWVWHVPVLHEAARRGGGPFVLEQGLFLAVGLWLWLSAVGGGTAERPGRSWAGVGALLFTSMHMTLLGALFALAPRPLYPSHAHAGSLADMHLGGAIMLLVGGASYLAGGLWLTAVALRGGPTARRQTA
jgi:putative membrane protein